MTPPNPMTREELLESAALDAFGLLDEYEASLYTRSFHYAPAAVQDEIIQLQANLVSDETFLTPQEPDPVLRQRVLDAVAEAIELEAPQLEPLAIIGRARPIAETLPAGRLPLPPSARFWRAAVFVLCAGLIVTFYFLNDAQKSQIKLAQMALSNNTDSQLERLIGPTFKNYLFDPGAKPVHFTATTPNSNVKAVIWVVENSDKAFLVIEGLPRDDYTITVIKQGQERKDLQNFESNGGLSSVHVALHDMASQLRNARLEISDHTGMILLATL